MSFSSSDSKSANIVSYSPVFTAFLFLFGGEALLFPLLPTAFLFPGGAPPLLVTLLFELVTLPFNSSAYLSIDFHFLIWESETFNSLANSLRTFLPFDFNQVSLAWSRRGSLFLAIH